MTKIPSSKRDPAAGKTWSLVVTPPKSTGDPVTAVDPFTTVAPQLLDLADDLVLAKSALGLVVANPGGKKLTVLVGTKKAKVLEVGEVAVTTVSAERAGGGNITAIGTFRAAQTPVVP